MKLLLTLILTVITNVGHANVLLGVYDPKHTFDKTELAYEELWIRWGNTDKCLAELKAIKAKGRTPVFNVEPWTIPSIGSSTTLLQDITAGKYDKVITSLATTVNSLHFPVFIRWGSEMERKMDKPWAGKPPTDYIPAYRHFVTIFKAISPTSIMIWAPIGNEGCRDYYPGEDVVDYVGFSLYEYPACTIAWYGQKRSFADWMDAKYGQFWSYGKPVIIVELGIYGTPAEQKAWLQDAFESFDDYPLLRGAIYYNALDPVSWKQWGGAGQPNWSISFATLSELLT